MQRLSGGGLVLYALTIFFMSVDWMMSIDPHWFSTIYGILFMGGQGLSAMAFTIAVVVLLARTAPMSKVIGPNHLHDLGKLLLAFVMLWAYFKFSQFLIIWMGNLPEEIPWYLIRMTGGWGWVSVLLIVGHFMLPYVLLLNRDLKRTGGTVATIAVLVIAMRLVDLFWLLGPEHGKPLLSVHWLDFVAPVARGRHLGGAVSVAARHAVADSDHRTDVARSHRSWRGALRIADCRLQIADYADCRARPNYA